MIKAPCVLGAGTQTWSFAMKINVKKIIFSAVIVSIFLISNPVFVHSSSPSVYFKAPIEFHGTGCPQGVSGANTDTMTVQFNQYDAAKPPRDAASGMFRTACSFVVPVNVPSGYQVSNLTAEWHGYAEGRTRLHREYFFAGQRGPSKTSSPRGDYIERDNLMHETWSPCGRGTVPMRINSSILAQSNPSYIAVTKMVKFRLKWRKCR
ncbi:MAG: DUF4360 domain-containing protein [Candidatus Electrothrix sp. AW2]|nr:DUF4360 domain-containing protein [Candidatus Electrothrix gigas]